MTHHFSYPVRPKPSASADPSSEEPDGANRGRDDEGVRGEIPNRGQQQQQQQQPVIIGS